MYGFHGERQVGCTLEEIQADHVQRYRWAASQISPGDLVLDAGCGVGYGSFILAQAAARVVAIDVDSQTLELARSYWQRSNIEYREGDLHCLKLRPKERFQAIVALEVIEHLVVPELFLLTSRKHLDSGSLLLLSCPNSSVLKSDVEVNPFHIHHYSEQELIFMLEACGYRVERFWSEQDAGIIDDTSGQFLLARVLASGSPSLNEADLANTLAAKMHNEMMSRARTIRQLAARVKSDLNLSRLDDDLRGLYQKYDELAVTAQSQDRTIADLRALIEKEMQNRDKQAGALKQLEEEMQHNIQELARVEERARLLSEDRARLVEKNRELEEQSRSFEKALVQERAIAAEKSKQLSLIQTSLQKLQGEASRMPQLVRREAHLREILREYKVLLEGTFGDYRRVIRLLEKLREARLIRAATVLRKGYFNTFKVLSELFPRQSERVQRLGRLRQMESPDTPHPRPVQTVGESVEPKISMAKLGQPVPREVGAHLQINIVMGDSSKGWVFEDMTNMFKRYNHDLQIVVAEDPIEGADVYQYFRLHLERCKRFLRGRGPDHPLWKRGIAMLHASFDGSWGVSFEQREEGLHGMSQITCINQKQFVRLVTGGIPQERIDIIRLGAGDQFYPVHREDKQDKLVLGFVGRLYPTGAKGEDVFKELVRSLDPSRFSFLFLGDRFQELADFCESRGFETKYFQRDVDVEYEKYGDIFRQMDVLLITSHSEGAPTTLFEALRCGLTIVSTPVGYVPEFLESDYLFDPAQPTQAVAILERILENRDELRRNRMKNALLVDDYDWKRFCEAYRRLWFKVAGMHYLPAPVDVPLITLATFCPDGEKHIAAARRQAEHQVHPNVEEVFLVPERTKLPPMRPTVLYYREGSNLIQVFRAACDVSHGDLLVFQHAENRLDARLLSMHLSIWQRQGSPFCQVANMGYSGCGCARHPDLMDWNAKAIMDEGEAIHRYLFGRAAPPSEWASDLDALANRSRSRAVIVARAERMVKSAGHPVYVYSTLKTDLPIWLSGKSRTRTVASKAVRNVEIVILSLNRLDVTKRLLDSIWQYTNPPYQIIIVDNCSDRETVEGLRQLEHEHENLKVLYLERNHGVGPARNIGFRETSKDLIVSLDNDMVVTEGWLSTMVECLEETNSLAVCPRILKGDDSYWAGPSNLEFYTENGQRYVRINYGLSGDLNHRARVTFKFGGASLFSGELLEHIGFYDEAFVVGWEDVDYSMRLLQAGKRISYEPGALLIHDHPEELNLNNPYEKIRFDPATIERSRRAFYAKWPDLFLGSGKW